MTKRELLLTTYAGKKMTEHDFGKKILYSALIEELNQEDSPLSQALNYDVMIDTCENRSKVIDEIKDVVEEYSITPGDLFNYEDMLEDCQHNLDSDEILGNINTEDIKTYLLDNFTPDEFVRVATVDTTLEWDE